MFRKIYGEEGKKMKRLLNIFPQKQQGTFKLPNYKSKHCSLAAKNSIPTERSQIYDENYVLHGNARLSYFPSGIYASIKRSGNAYNVEKWSSEHTDIRRRLLS